MSYWTHIVGIIYVDTYRETDDVIAYVDECLKNAPKITGSESDADIFINIPHGHNVSTDCDCHRCQYRDTIKVDDSGSSCEAPNEFKCPFGEYQTHAIITVCGNLRDRFKSQTKKEWNTFHRYIAKDLGFAIRNATCKVDGW